MRRRLGAITGTLVLAAVFAASWHFGIWLAVCAMAATAIALLAEERLAERAVVQRLAAWAVHAPSGLAEGCALERLLAADLAATARGCPRLLDDSLLHAQQTIDDPWVRALAIERLSRARDLAADQETPQGPRSLEVLSCRMARLATIAGFVGCTVAAAVTQHLAMLVPVTLCVAAAGLGGGEARRRSGLRNALRDEASIEPLPGPFLMPEAALVGALSALAASRPRALSKAATTLPTATFAQRGVAISRLASAQRLAGRRIPTLTRTVIGWMTTATALVAWTQSL